MAHSDAKGVSVPTELVERLEVATAGHRLFDAALWDLIDDRPRHDLDGDGPIFKRDPDDDVAYDSPPPFTASIDAALALAERVYPCWSWSVGQNVHHKYWLAYALALDGDRSSFQTTVAKAKTPALALCIAILKATTANSVGTKDEVRSEPNPTETGRMEP